MQIDIIKEAKSVFDIEITELEKLKNRIGDSFQKLVNIIMELKNNKVVDIFSVSILSMFQGKIQGSKTFDFSFIREKAFSKISKNSKASFLSLKYVLEFSFPLFISSLK